MMDTPSSDKHEETCELWYNWSPNYMCVSEKDVVVVCRLTLFSSISLCTHFKYSSLMLPSIYFHLKCSPDSLCSSSEAVCLSAGVAASQDQDFGTANLHVEVSDVVSVLVYVGVAKGNGVLSKTGRLYYSQLHDDPKDWLTNMNYSQ